MDGWMAKKSLVDLQKKISHALHDIFRSVVTKVK